MTAVISSAFFLCGSRSARGYCGDEFVLASAGISAAGGSLHSDEKDSTQRLPVSMLTYEISLWAAQP